MLNSKCYVHCVGLLGLLTLVSCAPQANVPTAEALCAPINTDPARIFNMPTAVPATADPSIQRPANFELILNYGVGAKNVVNTVDDTFTKDMIIDPSITTTLVLAPHDLDLIYQKMVEINFFAYADTFAIPIASGCPGGGIAPSMSYAFEVVAGDQTKTLEWNDSITNQNTQADKLRDLIKLIVTIIESKQEYKELPEARGGYA